MRFFLPLLGTLALFALMGIVPRQTSVSAGTARKMDVADMVDASGMVVQARVQMAEAQLGPRELIETRYVLAVSRTFWGEPATEQVVRIPGGVLEDGRGLLLAGMPTIEAGEEVLLFLSRPSSSGVRMPVGLAQGKFEVHRTKSGAVELVREGAGLQLANPATGEVSEAQPHAVFSYADVVGQVHAAVAAREAREALETAGSGR